MTDQIKRMEKEAVEQMLHYHEKNRKQRLKEFVKKAAGCRILPEDIIFWPTGLIANALAESYELWEDKEEVLNALSIYFDRWIDRNMPIYYLDDILCGEALIDLYQLTGKEKYKTGAGKMAEYIYCLEKQESDQAGSIPYRYGHKNGHVYVDGIGMICPFLCKYGVSFGDVKALDIALLQIMNVFEYGMEDKLFLPYHGFEYESRIKYGIIGWGRAVGWLLAGMAGTLKFLPSGHEGYEDLRGRFIRLIDCVSAYQKENGAFAWQLEALDGPEDSSATAMIARAVSIGLECGVTDKSENREMCRKLVRKAAEYISQCEDGGRVCKASGECMGFSQYPQVYGAYPWSQGPGLSVLLKDMRLED